MDEVAFLYEAADQLGAPEIARELRRMADDLEREADALRQRN
jgi:hypothetical protein